jgi:hypothetical protein
MRIEGLECPVFNGELLVTEELMGGVVLAAKNVNFFDANLFTHESYRYGRWAQRDLYLAEVLRSYACYFDGRSSGRTRRVEAVRLWLGCSALTTDVGLSEEKPYNQGCHLQHICGRSLVTQHGDEECFGMMTDD